METKTKDMEQGIDGLGLSAPERRQAQAEAFLQRCDAQFNAATGLYRIRWRAKGYHSFFPDGEMATPTRENLDYALALFNEGSAPSCERAEGIIRSVLELQDVNPTSTTYGVWPRLFEEPLAQMAPPDWNWADFCGVRLAHLLCAYGARMSVELAEGIRRSLKAAAYSIFRRNVGSNYTNIAVKGAVASALAGQLLNDSFLLDYAQERLEQFIRFSASKGGFQEYNSSFYGMIVLLETERALMFVQDARLKESLEQVHRLYWEQTARSLHLGLGQVVGPHCRTYADVLQPDISRILSERLGVTLPVFGTRYDPLLDTAYLIDPMPCPPEIREQIVNAPVETFSQYTYVVSDLPGAEHSRVASIWKNKTACLGSINYDNLWTQRRPLLGYWQADDGLAVLRVRLTHDGKDFASGVIRTQQHQQEAVSMVTLASDKGDFHDHLDAPKNGIFEIGDLELCIELSTTGGSAGEATVLSENAYLLQAGAHSALVQPLFAKLGDYPVNWEIRRSEGVLALCARVAEGQPVRLDMSTLSQAVFAFYLSIGDATLTLQDFDVQQADNILQVEKQGSSELKLRASMTPEPYLDT